MNSNIKDNLSDRILDNVHSYTVNNNGSFVDSNFKIVQQSTNVDGFLFFKNKNEPIVTEMVESLDQYTSQYYQHLFKVHDSVQKKHLHNWNDKKFLDWLGEQKKGKTSRYELIMEDNLEPSECFFKNIEKFSHNFRYIIAKAMFPAASHDDKPANFPYSQSGIYNMLNYALHEPVEHLEHGLFAKFATEFISFRRMRSDEYDGYRNEVKETFRSLVKNMQFLAEIMNTFFDECWSEDFNKYFAEFVERKIFGVSNVTYVNFLDGFFNESKTPRCDIVEPDCLIRAKLTVFDEPMDMLEYTLDNKDEALNNKIHTFINDASINMNLLRIVQFFSAFPKVKRINIDRSPFSRFIFGWDKEEVYHKNLYMQTVGIMSLFYDMINYTGSAFTNVSFKVEYYMNTMRDVLYSCLPPSTNWRSNKLRTYERKKYKNNFLNEIGDRFWFYKKLMQITSLFNYIVNSRECSRQEVVVEVNSVLKLSDLDAFDKPNKKVAAITPTMFMISRLSDESYSKFVDSFFDKSNSLTTKNMDAFLLSVFNKPVALYCSEEEELKVKKERMDFFVSKLAL